MRDACLLPIVTMD